MYDMRRGISHLFASIICRSRNLAIKNQRQIVRLAWFAILSGCHAASRDIEKETGQKTAPERENPSGQHAVIPADLQITGDLVSPVEGVIHGDITCRTLTVAGQPVIQGSVEAETARISGTSNGGQSPGEKGIPDESRQNGGGNLLHTQLSTTAIYADAVGAEEHQIMETKRGT